MINKTNCRCVKRGGENVEEEVRLLKEKKIQIEVGQRLINVICIDQHIDEMITGRRFVEQNLPQVLPSMIYKTSWLFSMADRMAEEMPLHEETWATHSCFLYQEGKLLFACEDIGRHNAVDKVIGFAILNKIELSRCAIYSSGRVPSDMTEKVIRAGIPVLVSKGVPTAEAVELAKKYHLTLICSARRDRMNLFTDFRKRELDALVLAGGKSSRMGGKHKGNLKIGGETFVWHLINEVCQKADHVWISYGQDIHEEYENCEIVTDTYQDCGPMGGLHAGLMKTDAEHLFVLACDMPFMKVEFLEMLEKYLTEEVDAVVPVVKGKIHPLAAIYKKRVLPVVEERLKNGNYRLCSMVESMNTVYVEIEEGQKYMLQNINTTEEYQRISY